MNSCKIIRILICLLMAVLLCAGFCACKDPKEPDEQPPSAVTDDGVQNGHEDQKKDPSHGIILPGEGSETNPKTEGDTLRY